MKRGGVQTHRRGRQPQGYSEIKTLHVRVFLRGPVRFDGDALETVQNPGAYRHEDVGSNGAVHSDLEGSVRRQSLEK